jgi:predicted transcriptional regulator
VVFSHHVPITLLYNRGIMNELLNVISASDKRRNLLILLNSGPREWDDIKRILNVTSTGMLPQIKILEEEHLIERDGRTFSLTPMGKILTAYMEPLVRTMDIFDRNKKYWDEHNLGALPYELLLDIREIGNYQIMETADEEIFGISEFLNNIYRAKMIKGISHTVHPRFPDFFLNLAKKGVPVSLILTPGVFKIIREKYHDVLEQGLKFKTSKVYVSKKDIKFSYIITDTYFSLSLFYNNGMFDAKHDVISSDPSALGWGERVFSYYLKDAVKIDSAD